MIKGKWLLCILGVLLFSAGWYGVTGLGSLVALVPLLLISRSYDSSRRSFWKMLGWAALTFGSWNVACAWWVWYAAPIGTVASTVAQILLFGSVFMLYHYISKRTKPYFACLILICGWIAAEYLYLTGEISFPWLLLGNGFANDTWAVQWYEYTGVFGGSLWVLISNILIFRSIIKRSRKLVAASAIFVAVPMLVSTIMFMTYREPDGRKVKVSVVQPNIDPYEEKFTLSQEEQNANLLALAALAPSDVDIIAMPETAVDDYIWEENVWSSPSMVQLREFMRTHYPEAQLVTGAVTHKLYTTESDRTETARPWGYQWYDTYNSVVAIDTSSVTTIYHKIKLVIGVEKMPYMKLLKPMEKFIVDLGGTTGRLGADNTIRVFRLRRGTNTEMSRPVQDHTEETYAVQICYESVYGEHFAGLAARGAQLMLIITNDGWWHDTPGYKQHYSFARLRAIETRRFIARSANTGISGFIGPRGDVYQMLGWAQRGVLTDSVTLNDKVTFYSEYGDYIGRICSLVFVLGVLYYIAYRFRRRSHLVK